MQKVLLSSLLLLACHVCVVLAFSDGSKLAMGNTATRRIYCHRAAAKRKPFHFDPECQGFCETRLDGDRYFNVNVSASTYWLYIVRVNITVKPDTDKAITGFSIYALDQQGGVAGSFVSDDRDVVVGTCSDVIMYSLETHAAFHKMADRSRKNVSIQWQPDGFNHGPVQFVIWIVNNHSDVYYMETPSLTCRRNGTYTLDLESTLHNLVDAVDLNVFERSFRYRSRKGYQLDLEDPFSPFENPPTEVQLVPFKLSDWKEKSGFLTPSKPAFDNGFQTGLDLTPDVALTNIKEDDPLNIESLGAVQANKRKNQGSGTTGAFVNDIGDDIMVNKDENSKIINANDVFNEGSDVFAASSPTIIANSSEIVDDTSGKDNLVIRQRVQNHTESDNNNNSNNENNVLDNNDYNNDSSLGIPGPSTGVKNQANTISDNRDNTVTVINKDTVNSNITHPDNAMDNDDKNNTIKPIQSIETVNTNGGNTTTIDSSTPTTTTAKTIITTSPINDDLISGTDVNDRITDGVGAADAGKDKNLIDIDNYDIDFTANAFNDHIGDSDDNIVMGPDEANRILFNNYNDNNGQNKNFNNDNDRKNSIDDHAITSTAATAITITTATTTAIGDITITDIVGGNINNNFLDSGTRGQDDNNNFLDSGTRGQDDNNNFLDSGTRGQDDNNNFLDSGTRGQDDNNNFLDSSTRGQDDNNNFLDSGTRGQDDNNNFLDSSTRGQDDNDNNNNNNNNSINRGNIPNNNNNDLTTTTTPASSDNLIPDLLPVDNFDWII